MFLGIKLKLPGLAASTFAWAIMLVTSHYVAQTGLKLTAIFLPQSSNAGITGMCHYTHYP